MALLPMPEIPERPEGRRETRAEYERRRAAISRRRQICDQFAAFLKAPALLPPVPLLPAPLLSARERARWRTIPVPRPAAGARARAAYRDPAYPWRACDGCGRPYRGPAVYCSLDCAVADA